MYNHNHPFLPKSKPWQGQMLLKHTHTPVVEGLMSCRMDSYETGCRRALLVQPVVLDTNSAKRRKLFKKAKIHVIILCKFISTINIHIRTVFTLSLRCFYRSIDDSCFIRIQMNCPMFVMSLEQSVVHLLHISRHSFCLFGLFLSCKPYANSPSWYQLVLD